MALLSQRQQDAILACLREWFATNPDPPTYRDLCRALGWPESQVGSLQKLLLEMKGKSVDWEPRKRRSLRLLGADLVAQPPHYLEAATAVAKSPALTTSADLLLSLCATAAYEWLATPVMATTVQGDEDDLPGDRSVIPQSVRMAMSHLDLLMLLSDRTPLDLQGFLTLLHTPVHHWPVEINLDNLSDLL
jgi:hypothetical protein